MGSPMVTGGLESSGSFSTSLAGFLVSPGMSVFAYSPLLLLLPWAVLPAWQRWPWECSAPGPRYLLPSTVFLLILLGAWTDRGPGRWGKVSLAGLAMVGGAVQIVLLTANWWSVIRGSNYRSYIPEFSFLFVPTASPIVASGRAIKYGHIDTVLWKLAVGWPGQESESWVAAGLAILWLGGSVLGAWLLWRHVGRPVKSETRRFVE